MRHLSSGVDLPDLHNHVCCVCSGEALDAVLERVMKRISVELENTSSGQRTQAFTLLLWVITQSHDQEGLSYTVFTHSSSNSLKFSLIKLKLVKASNIEEDLIII